MRALLILILTLGLGYGGFLLWKQAKNSESSNRINSNANFFTPNLSLQDSGSILANLESVLGASISNGMEVVTETINTVTGGKSEPIINEAISNFQKELSKLPEDQVKKIQYNYCKSIVEEYEKQL
ncbi:MAG: hypothetical protein Fur0011_7500 [Candidatus Microgenomates bacterium]